MKRLVNILNALLFATILFMLATRGLPSSSDQLWVLLAFAAPATTLYHLNQARLHRFWKTYRDTKAARDREEAMRERIETLEERIASMEAGRTKGPEPQQGAA